MFQLQTPPKDTLYLMLHHNVQPSCRLSDLFEWISSWNWIHHWSWCLVENPGRSECLPPWQPSWDHIAGTVPMLPTPRKSLRNLGFTKVGRWRRPIGTPVGFSRFRFDRFWCRLCNWMPNYRKTFYIPCRMTWYLNIQMTHGRFSNKRNISLTMSLTCHAKVARILGCRDADWSPAKLKRTAALRQYKGTWGAKVIACSAACKPCCTKGVFIGWLERPSITRAQAKLLCPARTESFEAGWLKGIPNQNVD